MNIKRYSNYNNESYHIGQITITFNCLRFLKNIRFGYADSVGYVA